MTGSISDLRLRWPLDSLIRGSEEPVAKLPPLYPVGGDDELHGMSNSLGWKETAEMALREVQAAGENMRSLETSLQSIGTWEGKFEAVTREENPYSRQLCT